MFCPKCGNADQQENTYCRQCGEFLPDLKALSSLSFGGNTPQQNARSISFISIFATILSLLIALWMYLTSFNVPFILWLGAAVLICNALWHLSNFYVVRKLAGKINRKNQAELNEKSDKADRILPAAGTNEFITPGSVTENTTRKLKVERE